MLRSDHAPLILSFLNRVFIVPNVRTLSEPNLVEALEDELFGLRQRLGDAAFPRSAREYLVEWASPDKGWLRRFYQDASDEAYFDLAPATERVITWLNDLESRSFVGTESRLLTLLDLLRQMVTGSETDPEVRLAELDRQREALDQQIQRTLDGKADLLDDTAMRDRFQQFTRMARELLSDFREVEQNFRFLDRSVREKITLWDGGKGRLLEEILGRRDAIDDSDQGRSFRAFWDFLMSDQRQQELTALLEELLKHPAILETAPDPRLRRIHYDWLAAGEHTQRTVASLSKQLRRFLDDQAWQENRRIMDLFRGIESKAVQIRESIPIQSGFFEIDEVSADIRLPFERTMFSPPFKPNLAATVLTASGEQVDTAALFGIQVVDKGALASHIRRALQESAQITLQDLVRSRPIEQGLAEVVAYLELASSAFTVQVDDSVETTLSWEIELEDGTTLTKQVHMPRVIFVR